MTYKNRITTLQESMHIIANKISELKVSPEANKEEIAKLITQNIEYSKEIIRLTKLEWEETYERLDLDDDR